MQTQPVPLVFLTKFLSALHVWHESVNKFQYYVKPSHSSIVDTKSQEIKSYCNKNIANIIILNDNISCIFILIYCFYKLIKIF